jgi:hypothetical protein
MIFMDYKIRQRLNRVIQHRPLYRGSNYMLQKSSIAVHCIVLYRTFKLHRKNIETKLYRGADKSLARPSSRCRRTESIVLLEIHAILTETLGEHAPSYATVKIGWPSLNVVIFPPVCPGRAKDLSAHRYYLCRL